MKTRFLVVFLFCLNILHSSAQTAGVEEYTVNLNDANNPCITPDQYKAIEKEIADNNRLLGLTPSTNKTASTTCSWPLKMANGLNDCSYYLVGNYVDQDPSAGIKDYHCGSITYDGHTGVDIIIEPYPFYKMDNNQVDIIAAAPGTIIAKSDGNFDKNCSVNNMTANYIIIQHMDGSEALYWHMKKNSLTAKNVGQSVVTGEFLGKVGSSGSSTLPHLHFEVWAGSTFSTRNDPYSGQCNLLNANSWWASQKLYKERNIVNLQVNNIAPVLPACPTTETPNEDSCFTAPGSARFYVWIRNDSTGITNSMRIINPNNTTFSSWSYNSTSTFNLASYYFVRTLPNTPGTYTFEAVWNGDTCRKAFKVNCNALGVAEMSSDEQAAVYPNPFFSQTVLTVPLGQKVEHAELNIVDTYGRAVRTVTGINSNTIAIERKGLSIGIYFYRLSNGQKLICEGKLIVQ